MIGLTLLQSLYGLDEDDVVNRWPENPYWQYLCGETFFQHRPPIVRSGLRKWRKRIKSKGMEALLQQTLVVGLNVGAVKQTSLKRVSVDTTVQPKAIAHPTDAKLLNRSSERLVNLAKRLIKKQRNDKNKLYSLHEPHVACISKGKAHKKYEFGNKVSVCVTNKEGFILGTQGLEGNPYDGRTLKGALDQATQPTGTRPQRCYVDRGYRGHGVSETGIFISGQRRGITPTIKRELKHRSAIEAVIGHEKTEARLG
jgi:IS5 family transposase